MVESNTKESSPVAKDSNTNAVPEIDTEYKIYFGLFGYKWLIIR